MSDVKKHLYAILYPNAALVASQLEPDNFAKHYSIGSSRHYSGKVIFIEIDLSFRHEYFPIDEMLEQTVPHPDGRLKHTKFISTYRVLEHLDFKSMGDLYAVNVGGHALRIQKTPYTAVNDPGLVRIFQELNPVTLLVASTYDQREFGKILTQPDYPKGCPKLAFTQFDLTIDKFLAEIETNPFMNSPFQGIHPHKLKDAVLELQDGKGKAFKSVSLASVFRSVSFAKIRHGFWICGGDEMAFYPMPSVQELEKNNHLWYRSMI